MKNFFLKIIRKDKRTESTKEKLKNTLLAADSIPWRSFEEARAYVHNLTPTPHPSVPIIVRHLPCANLV